MPDRIRAHAWESAVLGRRWSYSLRLPQGRPPSGGWPLVVLLHGAGRSHRTLVELGGDLPWLANLDCALLLPDGGLGFWTDSPAGRFRGMLLELLALVRAGHPVARARDRTAIGGWSMGGYGAIRFAQEYPDLVRSAGSVIGLLDYPNPAYPPERNFPVPELFGEAATWRDQGCVAHAGDLRGVDLAVFAACRAFDYGMNRAFRSELERIGIPHRYEEIDGDHDWPTVRLLLPRLVAYLGGRVT